MPDAELVILIRCIDALKHIKLTQVQSIFSHRFYRIKQSPSPTTRDGEANSYGASISVVTVVLAADGAAAAAAAEAAAVAVVAVMVTIKEGNTGKGKLSIITEVEEG